MSRALGVAVAWFAGVCFSCGGDSSTPDAGPDATTDAGPDAPADAAPACNLAKPFGAPVLVNELNTAANEVTAHLTHDELTVYFDRAPFVFSPDSGVVEGGVGRGDMLVATRAAVAQPFGAPAFLALDTPSDEGQPTPTGDDKTLYYTTDNPALVTGGSHIVAATRGSTSAPFASPALVAGVNGAVSDLDMQPYVLPNDLVLYLSSYRTGNNDLYRASRSTTAQTYAVDTAAFAVVNTSNTEQFPVVTLDELTLYYSSDKAGGPGGGDIWVATRASTSVPFGNVVNVAELNSTNDDVPTWISDDGCRIYLASDRAGTWDIYVATKPAN